MATEPTGTQYELRAGGAEAVVTEVGGGLRLLRVDGRDLVAGFGPDRPRPVHRGSVLAPWPNRVGNGRYEWHGRTEQLALTEPDRRHALHGLVCWTAWTLVERTSSSVVLGTRIWPQPGYPHLLDLQVGYALDEGGLTWRLEAANIGEQAAPYGCSVHPYLVPGPGRVDDWSLALPAATVLEVDERLLPRGDRPVAGTHLDLRAGTALRELHLDHAYTEVTPDPDGRARAVVRAADGSGVVLGWDPAALPWVQVHTAERPEPELDRAGLAVEPMSCPPDAFRSGQGLVHLAPGARHSAEWRIARLPG